MWFALDAVSSSEDLDNYFLDIIFEKQKQILDKNHVGGSVPGQYHQIKKGQINQVCGFGSGPPGAPAIWMTFSNIYVAP